MYLFFDTETTGLPLNWKAPVTQVNNWPRLVQLGYILSDKGGRILKEGDLIIAPTGFTIPREASDIHGITHERALNEGLPVEKALQEFQEAMNQAEYLVAHNMDYDKMIMGAEFVRWSGVDHVAGKSKICTMKSTVDYCAIRGPRGYKWPRLSELRTKLTGSGVEGAHNAMNDIRATYECFFLLGKQGFKFQITK